jgi:prolyl oligopeptidase
MNRRLSWLFVGTLAACGPRGAVTETIFGRTVEDPYRALEEDSPETQAWIDAQSAATDRYLAQHADPSTAEQLARFLRIGWIQSPALGGDRAFYIKREGDADKGSLYVLDDGAAQPRLLIDPNTMDGNWAIDWIYPSPGGRYVAYGLSQDGDERSILHVIDVEAGRDLDESIAHTKWSGLSWLEDETGFAYTRYPKEGEPDYDAENEDAYFPHLFFHTLGSAPDGSTDPLVFRLEKKTDFVGPAVSPDGKWIVLNVFHGWSQSDILLLDRTTPGATPIPVDVGGEHLASGDIHGDRIYMSTNEDHPRSRIVAAPLATPGDRSTWVEIVPEGAGNLEWWSFAGERLAVRYTEDVSAKLRLFAADGTAQGEIPLPTAGSVAGPMTQRRSERILFTFDSYFVPPTLYAYDPATSSLAQLDRVVADIDPGQYELTRATVPSADGTAVPVFVVQRKDLPRDGARPTRVTGYGGFNVPILPAFARNTLYWLERGGVFVETVLRGGSEFGEEWHRAGMLENKHHVFEDFEAVLRWLPSTGLTSPEHIAIDGASNGGLLVGATIVRCPDAFRAAIGGVGLYDMIRFTQFPPAEIWMTEYGDPSQPEDFAWLADYSPYHNVRDGTAYPSILIETADHDNRVSWRHSTKFAARLQQATSSGRPVLFYMDRAVGHGAGAGLTDIVEQYVRMYTFIETELGKRP